MNLEKIKQQLQEVRSLINTNNNNLDNIREKLQPVGKSEAENIAKNPQGWLEEVELELSEIFALLKNQSYSISVLEDCVFDKTTLNAATVTTADGSLRYASY